jgi:hypothetical protein
MTIASVPEPLALVGEANPEVVLELAGDQANGAQLGWLQFP